MKVVINWIIFIAIITAIGIAIQWCRPLLSDHSAPLPKMTGIQAIVFGFACAFVWVEVLKLGSRKPFSCLKCMAGWFTLIIAGVWHVEYWGFYLPVGVAVGAIYSALKMRYL